MKVLLNLVLTFAHTVLVLFLFHEKCDLQQVCREKSEVSYLKLRPVDGYAEDWDVGSRGDGVGMNGDVAMITLMLMMMMMTLMVTSP